MSRPPLSPAIQRDAKFTLLVGFTATDMAMVISKRFLRSMAQPFEISQDGISLWGIEDIKARQAQQAQARQEAGEPMEVDGEAPMQNGHAAPEDEEDLSTLR